MITTDVLDLLPDVKTALRGANDSLSAILLISQAEQKELCPDLQHLSGMRDVETAARRALLRLSALQKFVDALQMSDDVRSQLYKLRI